MAIHAAYATYERKLGSFGVLAGLRLEHTTVTADQRTMGSWIENSYLDVHPTLHLTYDLSDSRQFRLSYSRRINRPDDEDINPSYEYHDAFSITVGNPYLKPEQTDVVEAGYKYTNDRFDALVTGYFRSTRNSFTDVSRYIGNRVVLTTRENLAGAVDSGLGITVNGDVTEGFGIRLSANGYYSEVDPGVLGSGRPRSGLAWNGKLSLEYKLSPQDQIQFGGNLSARRFTAQGYRLPDFAANAGYRHAFSDGLSGVVTVTNIFDSNKDKLVLDRGAVSEVSVRRQRGRTIYVGLVFSFGGGEGRREDEERPGNVME
jgi:outer membrane receptor protein involved in Fe transport